MWETVADARLVDRAEANWQNELRLGSRLGGRSSRLMEGAGCEQVPGARVTGAAGENPQNELSLAGFGVCGSPFPAGMIRLPASREWARAESGERRWDHCGSGRSADGRR